jgi:hypothetical protein
LIFHNIKISELTNYTTILTYLLENLKYDDAIQQNQKKVSSSCALMNKYSKTNLKTNWYDKYLKYKKKYLQFKNTLNL